MPASMLTDFHAVIPAGGAGTRLWPLSRRKNPKFLLDLTGTGRTMIQATVDRLAPLAGADNVMIVTGVAHGDAVSAQLPEIAAENIVCEISPRDSMAAIGLAAALLQHRHGDVIMGSFAADHVIHDVDTFHDSVRQAIAVARAGYVVTIGIEPTAPSTAFGYIQAAELLGIEGASDGLGVKQFTEKPDAETAATYLAQGNWSWNAGMFITSTAVLLGHLKEHQPTLHDGVVEIAQAWDTDARDDVTTRVWPGLTKIAIDHAIAEPVAARGQVAVVPGSFDWDDVGGFDAFATLLEADEDDIHVLGEPHTLVGIDAKGSIVSTSTGRAVVVLGIPEAVVVDTPDALLVTTRAHSQQVKDVVDSIRGRGSEELL